MTKEFQLKPTVALEFAKTHYNGCSAAADGPYHPTLAAKIANSISQCEPFGV